MPQIIRTCLLVLGLFVSCTSSVLAASGQQIASQGNGKGAVACVSCHGADGEGNDAASFPRLAGLNAGYLQTQIKLFQTGKRASAVMAPIAKALSPEEIKVVTTYFAALQTPSKTNAAAPASKLGKQLAAIGSWADRHLPACNQCHGPGGVGIGSVFPALAGQQASYIRQQLSAWQQGKRSGDPNNLMKNIATRLTLQEINEVAGYFASLPAQSVANESTDTSSNSTVPVAKPYKSLIEDQGDVPVGRKTTKAVNYFSPPTYNAYPDGPFGEAVRSGEAIFNSTNNHSLSGRYVGNDLQCTNCHLDGGRLANSAPMWAAWVAYPTYRKKNKQVNDIVMRVQGCFTYSMNAQGSKVGHAPSGESQTVIDLLAYMYWISTGAPTGDHKMPGRGFPMLKESAKGFDPERGQQVYATNCAVCHGTDGAGVIRDGMTLFPPLWGERSYNWGAGMHKINNAAAFIMANMPLGQPGSLTTQQAWDVAAFINAQHRPQDPRFTGDIEQTTSNHHASKYDYYGKRKGPDGRLLGEGTPVR